MAYEHLMEKLEDELEALDKKVAQGHDLEKDEYECAKTWCGKHDLNSTGLYILDQFYHMM